MTNRDENKKEGKELVESLVKDQMTTRAMQKLSRGPLHVTVSRHALTLDALESQLALYEDAIKDAKDSDTQKKLEEEKSQLKEEISKLDADRIEGILTPLTYRDINDIKAAVTEAVIHFQEYKFDPEVILSRIVAEEKFMTVFCALKSLNNPKERYFKTLDEIAQFDEMTIFDLYRKWEDHFVLSDDEIKNS